MKHLKIISDRVYTSDEVFNREDIKRLEKDFVFEYDKWKITILAGFEFDGASIPRLAWRVIGHPWGEYLPAALPHDIFYATEHFPREYTDQMFLDIMRAIDVAGWRRGLMWATVRTAGGFTWQKHDVFSKKKAAKFLKIEYLEGAANAN